MKNKFKFYLKRIREGRLKEMARETIFVYSYARHYWKAMIVYTLLGLTGTVVSLLSGFVSRDLVDIITGHQTGVLLETFCMMIAVAISSQLITMLSSYFTTWVYNHVNNEVRADIFKKLIDTDWEALSQYHTGDLMTRWNSDSSTISNGILSWLPNVVINFFKFVSALGVVLANDASFAVFALLGIPVSLVMSKRLLTRMQNNNKRSMAMSSKMSISSLESGASKL
jgi:ABC-type multidrug transport system fused ATPase/permease subunit